MPPINSCHDGEIISDIHCSYQSQCYAWSLYIIGHYITSVRCQCELHPKYITTSFVFAEGEKGKLISVYTQETQISCQSIRFAAQCELHIQKNKKKKRKPVILSVKEVTFLFVWLDLIFMQDICALQVLRWPLSYEYKIFTQGCGCYLKTDIIAIFLNI